MEINNFNQSIRLGSGFPRCFDTLPTNRHEHYGFGVCTYLNSPKDSCPCLIRILKKENQIAMFNVSEESHIPEWWKDAEIIYSEDCS